MTPECARGWGKRLGALVECNRCVWVFPLLLVVLTACSAGDSGAGLERFEYARVCMGVRTRVVVYAPSGETAEEAAAAAFAKIGELDAVMSDYRRDSDLSRLCDRAGGPAVPVREELYDVLGMARRVSRASDGAFDVTVGPAVALWRQARRSGQLPSEAEIASARALIDWRALELGQRTVRLAKAGMRLDLGGIAKGYAAQRAVRVLRERGLRHAMVALAGDIVAGDAPPGQEGWRIAVVGDVAGDDVGEAGHVVLLLRNAAVSASGDAEQFVEVGGKRYSHVVDPRTGMGLTAVRAVSVVAPTGEEADALSTAACVLGPERGRALLREWGGVAGVFEEGATREVFDPGKRLRLAPR